eukprot:276391-Chlamydomonas_euryale.AAC.1
MVFTSLPLDVQSLADPSSPTHAAAPTARLAMLAARTGAALRAAGDDIERSAAVGQSADVSPSGVGSGLCGRAGSQRDLRGFGKLCGA